MSPRRSTRLVVASLGVILVTNAFWLFPHEGHARHTYERSELSVTNGSVTYHGAQIPEFAEANSLVAVACQPPDDEQARACAFDAHLRDHPPVALPNVYGSFVRPDFVEIDDTYYRRVHRLESANGSEVVVHSVERVRPAGLLAAVAVNLTGRSVGDDPDLPLEFRIAASGETVRTVTDLDEDDLGRVFRLGDSYYTVVRTERTVIDHGVGFLRYEVPRYLIAAVGLVLLAAVMVDGLARRTSSLDATVGSGHTDGDR